MSQEIMWVEKYRPLKLSELLDQGDQIADTVNYKKLKDKVVKVVESSSNRLLEALAYSIAKICLAEERVEKVKVTVDKPGALSYARSVAFELEMGR